MSELESLAKETHKFESRYLDRLVGPYPAEAELYRERSPLHHLERLSCPVIFFQGLEDEVVPLLRSDYGFEDANFYSAAHAVAGSMNNREGWSHPAGSNLVGWVKSHGNSPIVYLQGGDDGAAMANEHLRHLVHNAVRWAGSDAARDWAKARAGRAD